MNRWFFYTEGRFRIMLISIGLMFFLSPLVEEFTTLYMIFDVSMTLMLLAGIYSVSQRRAYTVVATIAAFPMLLCVWQEFFPELPGIFPVASFSGFVFSAVIITSIASFLSSCKNITLDLIFGSLIVYCFLGIAWAFLYSLVDCFSPGSFGNIITEITFQEKMSHFFYFSFVTLSTLGYGDITPVTEFTRSLTIIEAVTGQIYLVVMVAWLVGMKVSQDMEKKDQVF